MADVTTVEARYIADVTRYVSALRQATGATNDFAKSLPSVEGSQDRVKASSVALGAALGTLGAMVFAKATGAVQKYAMQGIQAAKDYEQTVISIEGIFQGTGLSMEQAATKTKGYLSDLRDFAAKTPFELPQILDATKRLLSIGYAADDVKNRMLPAIGDIVAALGQPPSSVSAVVYAFGQMKSAGRVMSQDLMQVGNALPGFNAKMALAKELFQGDMAALTKAMESGSLDSSRAIDVLITAMTKFGGAAGAMDRQSKTLAGVISTFNDTVNNALIDGLLPSLPVLSETLNNVMPAVEGLATAFAQALGPALIEGASVLQTLAPQLAEIIPPFIEIASTGVGLMRVLSAFAPILKVVADGAHLLATAIGAIPGPILTAVAALVVVRMAMKKLGIDAALAGTTTTGAMARIRLSVLTSMTTVREAFLWGGVSMKSFKLAATGLGVQFAATMRAMGVAVKGFLAGIGPIGWIIMAAGAAFEIFAGQSAAAKARIDEMSSSIDEATGKLNALGRASLIQTLTQEISQADWSQLDKLGLGIDEAIAAIEGGEASMTAYIDRINENGAALRRLGVDTHAVANNIYDWGTAVTTATDQAAAAKKAEEQVAISAAAAAQREEQAALQTAKSKLMATTASRQLTAAQEAEKAKTDSLAAAQTALTAAYNGTKTAHEKLSAVISNQASFDTAKGAVDGLSKALKKGVDYTKNNTEAQREGRAAIRDSVSAWVEYANATNDPVEKQKRLEQGYKSVRKELKKKGIKAKDLDVMQAFKEANEKTSELSEAWAKEADTAKGNGNKVGINFINGIVAALEANKGRVATAAAAVGQTAVDAAQGPDGTNAGSPSKKAIKIGNDFIDGILIALGKGKNAVGSSGTGVGASLVAGFGAALKSGGSLASVIDEVYGNIPDLPTPLEQALGKKGAEKWLKKHAKELRAVKQAFAEMDQVREAVLAAQDAVRELDKLQTQVTGTYNGETLSVPSAIENAFGSGSDLSSAIGMFDNLGQSVNAAYDALLSVAPKGEVKMLRGAKNAANGYLRAMRDEVAGFMIRKQQIEKSLQDLDKAHEDRLRNIANTYDQLDRDAEASLRATEARWDSTIKALQSALDAANKAYDEANNVLSGLINERDGFLKKIGDGYRSYVNEIKSSEAGLTAGSFVTGMQQRVAAIKQFGANIKALLKAGLDPSLVQEFVEAGPSSAGGAVAALAAGTASDIAAINEAQKSLADEVASFQTTASAQWFDAGIAQQQAIVAPLAAAAANAQSALDIANAARATEIAAAQKHIDDLKAQREAAIKAENDDYFKQRGVMEAELLGINQTLDARAKDVQQYFANLMDPTTGLPATTWKVGWEAINGIIRGLNDREPQLMKRARQIGDAVAAELRRALQVHSPSRVTQEIGQQVAAGLASGMTSGLGMVSGAATGLATAANPSAAVGSLGFGGGGAGTVIVQSGAVQITMPPGSMDMQSAEQIRLVVDEALVRLAREIRRSM